jgi:hypothetical protein
LSAEPERQSWFLEEADDDVTVAFRWHESRRCLVERFPFEVFYRLDGDLIVVVAVMHAARDPEAILRRVGG